MKKLYAGLSVLISAGPTHEYIDPVRFLGNPSTGQMGYALAEAAIKAGATVTLVSGPVALPPPRGVDCVPVTSALEMRRAMLQAYKSADIIFMSAAVADFRPEVLLKKKFKKGTQQTYLLKLIRNPDILAELGSKKKPKQYLVGFAAETHDLVKNATDKLKRKQLDLIVANWVKPGNAFGSRVNAVTLIEKTGARLELPSVSKKVLASRILAQVWAYRSASAKPGPYQYGTQRGDS